MPKTLRLPVVAGQFYLDDPVELENEIKNYLKKAKIENSSNIVRALIVPHAGYIYSGQVAAYAYKQISNREYERVILIGNAHAAYFFGIAIDNSDGWETPLGKIEIDIEWSSKLVKASDKIKINQEVHLDEHSLEVQLPFLQTILKPGFKIVPILFGQNEDDYKVLAEVLAANLSEKDLVIVSTDLSHYPSYNDANKIDQETLETIKSGDVNKFEKYSIKTEDKDIINEQTLICGVDGVKTIMELAKLKKWSAQILKYANSGDSSGSREQVVGYGAAAFVASNKSKVESQKKNSEPNVISNLNNEQKITLLRIARETIESFVKTGVVPDFEINDNMLNQKQGAFVTLHIDGKLRGCIGQIIPSGKPLWQVVRDMAIAASTEDPRFTPVSVNELKYLQYEISVLTKPEKIDDWKKIELGKHGVIVHQGRKSGVFLPQVATETGWSREEFLSQLCVQKAGLSPNCYKDCSAELQVFSAQVFDNK